MSNGHQPEVILRHDVQLARIFVRLRTLLRQEREVLRILFAYAATISLFSLIIPLTVQELINTFAFAIQPLMIVTLAVIMVVILLFVGGIRALQYYVVEIFERRIFVRVALALTDLLPRVRLESFKPKDANLFFETVLIQRALSVLLTDMVNVVVGGIVGLLILLLYHPYFLVFNAMLITGFFLVAVVLSHGGLRATMAMSIAKYETLNWIQEIANNLIHFKVTVSQPLLALKTDGLVRAYIEARQARFRVILRQYLGSVAWQALGHSGLIAMAGWLLSMGQLTLGQFVAAEVIVGSLLLNFDAVIKRTAHVFYLLTALTELDDLFSQPKDQRTGIGRVSLADRADSGIRIECRDLSYHDPDGLVVFEHFDMEVEPGERVAVHAASSSAQTALARVLGGIYRASGGAIYLNGLNLRDVDQESLYSGLGYVFEHQVSLFEGSLAENIGMGRSAVAYKDIRWALRFVELEGEVDAFALGLATPVRMRGKAFTNSLVQRVLLARAIVTRPQVLILEGNLAGVPANIRELILRRLCGEEERWSIINITCEPVPGLELDRRVILH